MTQPLAPILDMIETRVEQDVSRQAASIQVNINNENRPNMTEKKYINSGTMMGSALGEGNSVTNSDSFNTGINAAELAGLVSSLRQQGNKLPKETVVRVHPQLEQIEAGAEVIASESKKSSPNRGLLTLTKNGMATAVKTCAEIAPSLLNTADAVAKWIAEKI